MNESIYSCNNLMPLCSISLLLLFFNPFLYVVLETAKTLKPVNPVSFLISNKTLFLILFKSSFDWIASFPVKTRTNLSTKLSILLKQDIIVFISLTSSFLISPTDRLWTNKIIFAFLYAFIASWSSLSLAFKPGVSIK